MGFLPLSPMEITDPLLKKKSLPSPKKSVDRLNKSVSTPVVFFQRIDRALQSVPRLKIGKHISAAKPVDRLFGITDHIEHMIPFCLSVISFIEEAVLKRVSILKLIH